METDGVCAPSVGLTSSLSSFSSHSPLPALSGASSCGVSHGIGNKLVAQAWFQLNRGRQRLLLV